MNILAQIRQRAKEKRASIALPETSDERTLKAAAELIDEDLVKPVLVGDAEKIFTDAKALGIDLPPNKCRVIDPEKSERFSEFVSEYFTLRKAKGTTYDGAKTAMQNPLYFAAMLVRRGDADGCVAGAVNTTADVLRAGIQIIGANKSGGAGGTKLVSSFFLMAFPSDHPAAAGRVLTYADCGVVPYPNAEQLSDIAITSAESHRTLTGEEPVVAMLSFSTMGSAEHESIDKIREAVELAKRKRPDLKIDGEMQFDAAFVETVGQRKAPKSAVAGRANVFIFPNLDAGNIAYKLTERLAGAKAIGPIIQGLAKPMNDLSRGATPSDIIDVCCVCALRKS